MRRRRDIYPGIEFPAFVRAYEHVPPLLAPPPLSDTHTGPFEGDPTPPPSRFIHRSFPNGESETAVIGQAGDGQG